MNTDGLFRLHAVTVRVTPNKPFKIIPFSDVHWDSDLHARERWLEFLDYAKSQRNAYFLGVGDYLDSWSTSERHALRSGNLHDTTIRNMERDVRARIKTFCKEISFMRGRCLGIISGNHKPEFADGTNGDHIIASELNAQYLGVAALVRVKMMRGGSDRCNWKLDIFAHHGKGGSARLAGGSLNTVGYIAEYIDADILLMGHDHRRGVLPLPPLLSMSEGNHKSELVLKERQRWIGRTGSFLKAYVDGKSSYNVDDARGPCSLGHVEFEVTPRRYTSHSNPSAYTLHVRATA